nr:hypothetical protein CFP56_53255 [Quercus suber]
MFPSKPRPVPSKAALKVLYQLAYITSGTAVGIATLCVEERRRQLQLVQKVADNAKRLRQSPRYYQNVALAEDHPGVERRLRLAEYEDVKGPDLPSVVEKGYRRNSARGKASSHKRNARTRESYGDNNVRADPLSHDTAVNAAHNAPRASHESRLQKRQSHTILTKDAPKARLREHSAIRPRNPISRERNASKTHDTLRNQGQWSLPHNKVSRKQFATEQIVQLHGRTSTSSVSTSNALEAINNVTREDDNADHKSGRRTLDGKQEPASEKPVALAPHEVLERLRTVSRRSSTPEKELGSITRDMASAVDATHDVDLFLEHDFLGVIVDKDHGPPGLDQAWSDLAGDLLLVVLQLGSWSDVVRLSRWMDARMILNPIHLRSILSGLASRKKYGQMSPDILMATCNHVFALKSFQCKALRYRFEHTLEILVGQFATSGGDTAQDQRRFTKARLSSNQAIAASMLTSSTARVGATQGVLTASEKEALSDAVLAITRKLLAQNRYADAIEIVSACGLSIPYGNAPESLATLVSRKFHVALTSDELTTCAMLLRIENWNLAEGSFASYRDFFIRACHQAKAFHFVEELFVNPETMIDPRLENLDDDDDRLAVLTMAAALSSSQSPSTEQTTRDSFVTYYTRLSRRLRVRVAEDYPLADVMGAWANSRNYSKTISRLQALKNGLGDGDSGATRAVLLAQLDVQIRHDDFEMARDTLAVLHKSERADYDTVGRAAFMLAKTHDWKHFDELLKLGKKSGFLLFGPKCVTKLNAAISVFSRSHSALETWSFVTNLIHTYEFIPTQATTEIMLDAFTSSSSYDLIPHWLRYLKTLGLHFDFNAKIVVRLLTRYYRENRPSHVLVISFCQNLCKFAPCLAGLDYMKLVEEAVGFDLRNFAGLRHSTQNTIEARARLQCVSFRSEHETSTKRLHPDARKSPATLVLSQNDNSDNVQDAISCKSSNDLAFSDGPHSPEIGSKMRPSADAKLSAVPKLSQQEQNQTLDDWAESFNSLRPSYQTSIDERSNELDNSEEYVRNQNSTPVRQMILALSLKQNDKVLSIYEDSLDSIGLPTSPLALEVAIEASLRLHHGNTAPAEIIMTRAREAGMSTACGMGPMLIHQIRNFSRADKQNGRRLRVTVLQYYRLNQKRGLPVKHDVATTAAFTLLRTGRARDAVRILEGLHRSDWAQGHELDLAAMTVLLRGYAALGEKSGIKWVIDTVIARNMRIDLKFLKALREISKFAGTSADINSQLEHASRTEDAVFLSDAIELFRKRRAQQLLKIKNLGSKLTAVLAHCANQASSIPIDVDAWPEIEKAMFGAALRPIGLPSDATPQEKKVGVRRAEAAARDSNKSAPQYLLSSGASNSGRQRNLSDDRFYSKFLNRGLITADGKMLAFRKTLVTSTSHRGWTARPYPQKRKGPRKFKHGQIRKDFKEAPAALREQTGQ